MEQYDISVVSGNSWTIYASLYYCLNTIISYVKLYHHDEVLL